LLGLMQAEVDRWAHVAGGAVPFGPRGLAQNVGIQITITAMAPHSSWGFASEPLDILPKAIEQQKQWVAPPPTGFLLDYHGAVAGQGYGAAAPIPRDLSAAVSALTVVGSGRKRRGGPAEGPGEDEGVVAEASGRAPAPGGVRPGPPFLNWFCDWCGD